ncbi:hypothetical protein EST38_g13602 [Candolleomyces aberdarensis]|uniref:Nephrocystin 3-like N-terminal domain-containing protein n=1 Tax=Candolleomyces aberdarensis TaxID=2316362 RepID=A0A4Q2CZI7_9AGAR|nr:hypothetical protein EST38_g13602 [Candolleomyces aberdarensis]
MANIDILGNSHGLQAETIKIVTHISSGLAPLKELEPYIAPQALDDSAERSDAPKCFPETRVALQGDLYSWMQHGDAGNPNNMKWVTGPAGTGKTAVMGSLTERCKKDRFPVASFFFSSTGSIGRRTKTAFVTTIAYQLAQHRQDLKDAIAAAIEADAIVFTKNLNVQMEKLILAPLYDIATGPRLQGVIIVDGLDECGAEQSRGFGATGSTGTPLPSRTKEDDQLEILQVLHKASLTPTFPFRIIVASRPEYVFREFFNPPGPTIFFAPRLDLHEDYHAEADITLYLNSHFSQIRRRCTLSPSWPPTGTIATLVKNASGQFIYATTIIRFLDMGRTASPQVLLDAILVMKSTSHQQIDALYSHILESSGNAEHSVRWIRAIDQLNRGVDSGEAGRVFENLHSLIRIPPSDNHTTPYAFYHKTLLDFLIDKRRCLALHVERAEISTLIWESFVRVCTKGSADTGNPYSTDFLDFLFNLKIGEASAAGLLISWVPEGIGLSKHASPPPATVDWWVSTAVAREGTGQLLDMFRAVHQFRSTIVQSCPVTRPLIEWSTAIGGE